MADWLVWDGGALTADVVTRVATEASVQVTEHPVETGSVIADHVIRAPETVSFDFAQSRTTLRESEMVWKQTEIKVRKSLFRPSGLLAVSTIAGAAVSAGLSALGLGDSDAPKIWSLTAKDPDKDRIEAVRKELLGLLNGATECTFIWQGMVLQGYLLTSVTSSTQSGSGGLVRFTVEGRQVQTVATAALSLSALAGLPIPSILTALPLLNRGKKGVEKVAEQRYEQSLMAKDVGLNLLGGNE
jgi:hypothetical protein